MKRWHDSFEKFVKEIHTPLNLSKVIIDKMIEEEEIVVDIAWVQSHVAEGDKDLLWDACDVLRMIIGYGEVLVSKKNEDQGSKYLLYAWNVAYILKLALWFDV